MIIYFQKIMLPVIVCLFILLSVHITSADEPYRQFSLAGGLLSTTPADGKKAAPGFLTARYGLKIAKGFLPYFGTGLAYTYQPDVITGDITRFKTGMAAQFGFNYLLSSRAIFKLDYKYLAITPDQPSGDNKTPPQSFGIGLDFHF